MKFSELLDNYSHLLEANGGPLATPGDAPPLGPTAAPGAPPGPAAPAAPAGAPGEVPVPPDITEPEPDITEPSPMVPEGEFDLIKQIAEALTVDLKGDDVEKIDNILSLINDPESPITADNARPVLTQIQAIMDKYVKSTVDAEHHVNPAIRKMLPGTEIE
jgi:hypothetical protein